MNLRKYLFIFWVLLAFNHVGYAQIIYTDIPDATPNATYPLDLNNDSVVDFFIQFDLVNQIVCKPQNNNAYAGNILGGLHLPWALSASNGIGAQLATWYDTMNPGIMAYGSSSGYWAGVTDRYLALKLNVGTNTYYGWARFDISVLATSFTIKDYAYESTPNTQILSGQTAMGVSEIFNKNSITIFPNPFQTTATIQSTFNMNQATLIMVNALGQQVKQWNYISGQNVPISREFLPNGLYFVYIKEGNKILAVEKINIVDGQ